MSDFVLAGNIDEAMGFVRMFNPGFLSHLFTINPESGKIGARTFEPHEDAEMRAYLEKHMGKSNIHFLPNLPIEGFRDKKPRKSDMLWGTHLYVDVDTPDEQALTKLQNYTPKPSTIIFSGGGYQAFWALEKPSQDFVRIERINKALAADLGGDHCHNIDRIMRVPGTINIPNAKKARKGRVPTLAYVVSS